MKTILNALGFLVPVVILPVLVVSQLIAMNTRSQESLKRNTDSAALHIVKDSLSCKGDSTKGKTVLYIGDSHTSYMYGWQDQLSKLTGMVTTTLAKGGMRTDWMLRNSRHMFAKKFDYCVIWGGANDAASMYSLDSSISNAINPLRPPANRRAVALGVKLYFATALRTAFSFSAETLAVPLRTRETVAALTLAALAT